MTPCKISPSLSKLIHTPANSLKIKKIKTKIINTIGIFVIIVSINDFIPYYRIWEKIDAVVLPIEIIRFLLSIPPKCPHNFLSLLKQSSSLIPPKISSLLPSLTNFVRYVLSRSPNRSLSRSLSRSPNPLLNL